MMSRQSRKQNWITTSGRNSQHVRGELQHDPEQCSCSREAGPGFRGEALNKAELAIEQVTLLLNMPEQPDAKRAEWLGLTAAWHLKYRQDSDSAGKFWNV